MELIHSLYIINTTIAIIIITIVICIIIIIILIICPWRNSVPGRVSAAEQCSLCILQLAFNTHDLDSTTGTSSTRN